MTRFIQRSQETELMDEEAIEFEEFHECLQELERINALTFAYRPTLNWLRPWLKSGEPFTLLDAGCGGGDMLRRIEQQLSAHKDPEQPVKLIGVDLNPWSKKSALIASGSPTIRYETGNIFEFEPDQPTDIIICSLFTHHLPEQQLIQFLQWIDGRARKGWFINDLHRHPVPYYFIKAATRLFSRSRVVRNDAAVSVARAFTSADWRNALTAAGITEGVQVQWFFPFRLCLSCVKE